MCLLAIKLIRKIQYTISRRKLKQQFAAGTVKMLRRIRRPKAANFSIMPPAAAYLSFSLFTFLSSLHPQGASQSASMILICPAVYWVSLMTMSLIRATSVASRPSSPAATTTLHESEPMNTTQSA